MMHMQGKSRSSPRCKRLHRMVDERNKAPRTEEPRRWNSLGSLGFWFLDIFCLCHPGANWIRPDAGKRRWRAVVDQLATLKADHNVTCREQSRPGGLTKLPLTAGFSRRGPKVSRQIRTAAGHVGYARG